jgi:Protein of unknown function (DUF1778)
MAKTEMIVIRVDLETKRRFEEAAEGMGLTLTSFLLRTAEAAAEVAARKRAKARLAPRPAPRKTPGACPAFFKATCWEARRGGGHGYDWAGRKLIGCAASLIAADTTEELFEKFEELKGLIWARNDHGVLAWFDRELPRCMELIPQRRRASFLAGVYTEVEEDDGVLTP